MRFAIIFCMQLFPSFILSDAQKSGAIDPNLEAEGSPPPSKKRLPSNSTTSNGATSTAENINNSSAKGTKPTSAPLTSPLADHCRPTKLDEIIGQDDVTGIFPNSILAIDHGVLGFEAALKLKL